MKTNNHIQNVSPSHLSIESYHKLNRASNVAFHMHLHIRRCEMNAAPLLWVPHLFSYIHDDIADVLEELKNKGLCDEWLSQSDKHSGGEE
ncbi:Derepression protein [Erwinia psidii]|uniref:Derepression protein n=1 Tax=Erwinia psidii TaxID=69224 RepID=UPI00226BA727|nr:Derepression protein [Erwinia psidii]MCX8967140.1 Derepression protein [Erwinia psidii]